MKRNVMPLIAVLIAVHCSLLTLPGCGGDDNGGGSSSDAAEHPLRERLLDGTIAMATKGCEVAFACETEAVADYGSLDKCLQSFDRDIIFDNFGFDRSEEHCLTEVTPLWEACVAAVTSRDPASLCGNINNRSFATAGPELGSENIYAESPDFPDCVGAAQARLNMLSGCFRVAFLTATERE